MDGEERMHQVEVVMDEVGDRVPVVVHVGAMSTRASVKLAQQAAAAGAAGVSSVPPFYFKYTNDQIYGYYRDIAEATDLPMIVYNIPLAGMMTVDMIQRLSGIDNVKGVKYTGTAIYEVTQIKDRCKEGFRVYGGCDELASSNIALGVDGIIGSFYNVIPDLFARIWEAVKSGRIEEATRLQQGALHIISTGLGSGSIMACLKLWLRTAGVPAGYARRPFTNFSEADGERLIGELLRIDREEELGLTIASRIRERKA
jgi:dihydrodipicolinate synthase/N-acetylneuraminate lyase